MAKKVRKTITLNEKGAALADMLMDAIGADNFSQLFIASLNALKRQERPAYIYEKKKLTPEEKMQSKLDAEKYEQEQYDSEGREICKILDGEVVEQAGGTMACKWYTYTWRDRTEQEQPLHMMTQRQVEQQFDPSKEKIEELRANDDVHYAVEGQEDDEE